MKKLLYSIIIISAGLFVVDRIVGEIMWWINQHTNENASVKIRHMVNDVNADVLLMGTSRCNRHYVPSVISDSIGMSVYNGGIDASDNIFAHYTLLNLILKRYTPKVICLEVSTNDFIKSTDSFSSVSFFAPYFGQNEQSDSIFHLANLYWQYQILHMYRFNAKATSNIAGLFSTPQEVGKDGYVPTPQPTQSINKIPKRKNSPTEIDSLKLKILQRFINICKQNGILTIFTISPSFSIIPNSYYDVIKKIAHKNNITVLDYHSPGVFLNHPDYYKDIVHLWHKGAYIYSSMFASELKKILHGKNHQKQNNSNTDIYLFSNRIVTTETRICKNS